MGSPASTAARSGSSRSKRSTSIRLWWFASRQHQPVDAGQIVLIAHQRSLRAEPIHDRPVLTKVSLQGQHADHRRAAAHQPRPA